MTDTVAGGLDDGASDSWRTLMARIAVPEPEDDGPEPPPEVLARWPDRLYEQSSSLLTLEEAEALREPVPGTLLNLRTLAAQRPPEFQWFVPGWLSPHPTLLSGRGGIGKSLASLQMCVALAAGKPFLGRAVDPVRVLLWSCEEDVPELHRRLSRICHHYGVSMADLDGWLHIDCRHGQDNTLLGNIYGVPTWTRLQGYLREQVRDLGVDVFVGDNIAHMFACSENDRHPVTMFTSWLSGLAGRPWCPLLIGHVSKAAGSEYSGSTAWENAVRMRWYLGDKMPDEPVSEEEEPGNLRFLCKRKTNYDQKDYLRFQVQDGILIPEQITAGATGLMAEVRVRKTREIVLGALRKLADMGIHASEKGGQNYLPRLMKQYQLMDIASPRDVVQALSGLMVDGIVRRDVVGRDNARRAKEGLVIVGQGA